MEDSKIEGYSASAISLLIGVLIIATSNGWNPTVVIFGSFFGILGILGLYKPDSSGQVTSYILKRIQRNAEESNRTRTSRKKEQKVTQIIHNEGTMNNVLGSKNTSKIVNNPEKKTKRKKTT
jgi:hypothetical protein